MKTTILSAMIALTAGSLIAADSNLKDEISNAAKALGEKANYSWKTTVVVPDDAQFRPGPTDGTSEKDGYTHVKMTFFDNPFEIVMKGERVAYVDQEGNWQLVSGSADAEGPGMFMSMIAENVLTPVKEAANLALYAKELKKDEDAYSSDLTEDGAKALQAFRGGPAGSSPTVSNAKGSVKFWLKDGQLTKYEFKVKGTVDWNGNSFDNDRTTTVEIKDVGTTKVEVPEAAKKKFS